MPYPLAPKCFLANADRLVRAANYTTHNRLSVAFSCEKPFLFSRKQISSQVEVIMTADNSKPENPFRPLTGL